MPESLHTWSGIRNVAAQEVSSRGAKLREERWPVCGCPLPFPSAGPLAHQDEYVVGDLLHPFMLGIHPVRSVG